MKLNCDMGESFAAWTMGDDAAILPFIDMCNIACGGHAGDPQVMAKTAILAKEHQVMIGAHPGYPDLAGFGRRSFAYTQTELAHLLLSQIGSLQAIAHYYDIPLHYVKTHGALYNDMHIKPKLFNSLIDAVESINPKLKLVVMAGSVSAPLQKLAQQRGIELIFEAFCDRRYVVNGTLQKREEEGACITNADEIVEQARSIIQDGMVFSADGASLPIEADTLCIHGDNPLAVEVSKRIQELLR